MALSTKKKNIIVADWKTGAFSKKQLEIKHKITFKTLAKLLKGISATNADTVEAMVVAENAKNSIKNPIEIRAVENIVKNRMKVAEVSNKLLNKIEKTIDNNTKLEKRNIGDGVQVFEEVALGSSDHKNLADAIDKTSITLGVNQRFSNSQVSIQNNQTQNIGLAIQWS